MYEESKEQVEPETPTMRIPFGLSSKQSVVTDQMPNVICNRPDVNLSDCD